MTATIISTMTRTKQQPSKTNGFAQRLTMLRKQRGITQIQLAHLTKSTQRNISHYETGAGYPPAPVLGTLAEALAVSADELLGINGTRRGKKRTVNPKQQRLWKKFQQMADLPEKDQRAVIRLINSLSQVKGRRRAS